LAFRKTARPLRLTLILTRKPARPRRPQRRRRKQQAEDAGAGPSIEEQMEQHLNDMATIINEMNEKVMGMLDNLQQELSSFQGRLAALEESDAAPEAGGTREAAVAGDAAPIWTNNPINQRAAKFFPAENK
jgi:hypothetical protein